jgi:Spy/CpxP family protein refolding chaperone
MIKRYTAILSVLALAASPCFAQAEGWHHHGIDLFDGVVLTSAQKSQLHEMEHANRREMRSLGSQMHALHDQVSTALFAGASTAQITPLIQQQEALRAQMDGRRLAMAVQIRSVLTPQQLQQAATDHAQLAALRQQEQAIRHGTARE